MFVLFCSKLIDSAVKSAFSQLCHGFGYNTCLLHIRMLPGVVTVWCLSVEVGYCCLVHSFCSPHIRLNAIQSICNINPTLNLTRSYWKFLLQLQNEISNEIFMVK